MAAISQSVAITLENTLTAVGDALAADSRINIYVINKTISTGKFRIAVSPLEPTGGEYIYYDFPLKPSGTFIAADVYVKATDKVWIYAPIGWAVRVDGVSL